MYMYNYYDPNDPFGSFFLLGIYIFNSEFKNIHSASGGLPIFEFGIRYPNNLNNNLDNHFIHVSVIDNNVYDMDKLDLSVIPYGTLFSVTAPSYLMLDISLYDVNITRTMSQHGLFEIIAGIQSLELYNCNFIGMRGVAADVMYLD